MPALVNGHDPQSFGSTPLLRAVQLNDRAAVDVLLELGADVNQKSDWWAGGFGVFDGCSDEMGSHLLERGAKLTPHGAARLGMVSELRAMLKADPEVVNTRGGDGQLPLHFARTLEVADLLLEHGAKIDAVDVDHGSTAAHWLGDSRPGVVRHLAEKGAAVDPFLAARIGDVALLARLVAIEPEDVKVRVSATRFSVPPPAAGHIYRFTIGDGATLLHAAAGTAVENHGQNGSNGAGKAGASGKAEVSSGAPHPSIEPGAEFVRVPSGPRSGGPVEVIRWLSVRGADVNARGGYDDATPLHTAAWADNPEAAAALIDAGAEINAPSGQTHHNEPIGWAIVGGSLAAVRVLKERGATIREHHRADAKLGAKGQFRELHPLRKREAWEEIDRELNG